MRYHVTPWVLGAVLVLGTGGASAGNFDDLWRNVFSECVGCHGADANGGFKFSNKQEFLQNALNDTSSSSSKLRIHPYAPSASFLVDKLRGHVRKGNGDPMPRGETGEGLEFNRPGYVDAVIRWIEGGAHPTNDFPGPVSATKPQPAFEPQGSGSLELTGDVFTVSEDDAEGRELILEGSHTSEGVKTDPLNDATYITAIHIEASAGTESVVLYRGGDTAPLAVARGESLELQLPEGVGIPIDAEQQFRIVQLMRNEYWQNSTNETTGQVVIHLETADQVASPATPFIDTTGTDFLAVPSHRVGITGGAWPGSPPATVQGAAVGIWTDRRAVTAGLADVANLNAGFDHVGNVTANLPTFEQDLRSDYVTLMQPGVPVTPLGYACVHNNGFTNVSTSPENTAFVAQLINEDAAEFIRPLKTACEDSGDPFLGLPRIVGGTHPVNCVRDHEPASGWGPGGPPASLGNDCEGIGDENCAPATLVGGPGVDDGRCALVGLWW